MEQGECVSREVVALVANSVEMTGISVDRLDRILSDRSVRTDSAMPCEVDIPHGRENRGAFGRDRPASGVGVEGEIGCIHGHRIHGLGLDVLRGTCQQHGEVRLFKGPQVGQTRSMSDYPWTGIRGCR